MGKNLPHLHPMISLENGNPGCMKGIFHHFNNRKWYNVKKKLPNRKISGSRPADVVLEAVNRLKRANDGHEEQKKSEESTKSSNHGRSSESGSVHKSSMKSRLKALFSEEVCRRKGRHHRSSSYPTRMPLDRVPSLHRASSAENETLNDSNSSHSLVSSLLDPALPRICGEPDSNGATCSLCAAKLTKNSRESEAKIASFQESKIFFDALDLLNIRKELFMKVLQDPTTSLSHQVQNQRASTSKLGLTKSVSFPTPGSSGAGNDINYPHVCTKENIIKQPLLIQDSLDSAASIGSPKDYKKQHQHVNKLIMKRFKNLREKIKHAMKEPRKERQRIVMDGVLHKIPVGYPKNAEKDGDSNNDVVAQNWCKYSPVDNVMKNDQFSSEGNHGIRRTASFNEVPLSRYNRLYDLTYKTEASYSRGSDEHVSRSAVSRKKASMTRILSLPDMRSQSFSRLDRWLSPEIPMKFVDDVDKCFVPPIEEDETTEENGISSVEDSEPAADVEPGEEEKEEEDLIPYEKETSQKQTYNDLLIQVGLKNRAEFEYVKDVLEMSGFTGTEILGKWHSDGQPVDPMIFLEVEGCVPAQPGCSGNEESGNCNHLLLFDLINEVLLEIYKKTFSYWPKLLTNCSRIHPMPVGYHLLEDVWSNINWYLQRSPEIDPSLDDAVSHDLSKNDGWMNVQFEAECVCIELEDMVFDDLLDELVFSSTHAELIREESLASLGL